MKPRYTSAVFVPKASAAIGFPRYFRTILRQGVLRCHAGHTERRQQRRPGYADCRLRGRPPLAPLAFAATAFAFDFLRPPRRPVAAANRRMPNARSTRAGT